MLLWPTSCVFIWYWPFEYKSCHVSCLNPFINANVQWLSDLKLQQLQADSVGYTMLCMHCVMWPERRGQKRSNIWNPWNHMIHFLNLGLPSRLTCLYTILLLPRSDANLRVDYRGTSPLLTIFGGKVHMPHLYKSNLFLAKISLFNLALPTLQTSIK